MELFYVIVGICFLYGTIIGSFLGVIIERLPKGESIIHGRSHCDYCRKNLRWFELIPIFSFLFQRGKCLRCHKRLSWRYPVLEISTGIVFSFLSLALFPAFISLFFALVIACVMIVIVMIDLDYMIIPDSMVVLGSIAAIGFTLSRSGGNIQELFQNNIPTAVASFFIFYALWLFTKKRGIGFGDVKLVFFLGVIVGFPQVIGSLYLAFLTGAVIALILVFKGRKTMKSAVPFGPFLILGTVLSFILPIQTWIYNFL